MRPTRGHEAPSLSVETLEELRLNALAATKAPQVPPKDSRRAYFKRSAAVKFYVLARAAGHCESCGKPAPFLRNNNHRGTSVKDTAPGGGISGRLSITLSTKPKSSAISAVIKLSRSPLRYGDLNFCHRFGSANLADFSASLEVTRLQVCRAAGTF